jgi:DNA topoisomerase VI subunit B
VDTNMVRIAKRKSKSPANGNGHHPQKVKTQKSANRINQYTTAPRLQRVTFQTSREMDFFSRRELITQTGHPVSEWHLVFPKECLDNSLDACEESGIAPVIEVTVDKHGIGVQDNGPGLPEKTLEGALDFKIRASSREAYVSPCRGAQGNALKTLLPMPRVLDPKDGRFIVEAHGVRHVICCRADPISQRAVIDDKRTRVKSSGTLVRIEWGGDWPFADADDEYNYDSDYRSPHEQLFQLCLGFVVLNPHLSLTLDLDGKKTVWPTLDPSWTKWRPDNPLSPHWYEPRHLERLIAAYITHDRDLGEDRLVSDFLKDFEGQRNKVLRRTRLAGKRLSDLVLKDDLHRPKIHKLLTVMQEFSKPVQSNRLGVIGRDHLEARLLEMGIEPNSFTYQADIAKRPKSVTNKNASFFLPSVIECASGYLGPKAKDRRGIYMGVNFSAAIKNPFRSFGNTGEGLETVLYHQRVTRKEPVILVLHLTQPRVEYTDRGKSAILTGE